MPHKVRIERGKWNGDRQVFIDDTPVTVTDVSVDWSNNAPWPVVTLKLYAEPLEYVQAPPAPVEVKPVRDLDAILRDIGEHNARISWSGGTVAGATMVPARSVEPKGA